MTAPIPRTLETPPRTTGNAQQDFPIMIDWFYRAYQVIVQAVNYINEQVQETPDLDINDLPDPTNTTLAQAQNTANLAYALADQADGKADTAQAEVDAVEVTVASHTTSIATLNAKFAGNVDGTVTVSDANTGATVTFGTAQVDTNYTVMIQPKTISGAPATNAYIIKTKTYGTADFSFTLIAAPGVGSSITYDWQLVRNT